MQSFSALFFSTPFEQRSRRLRIAALGCLSVIIAVIVAMIAARASEIDYGMRPTIAAYGEATASGVRLIWPLRSDLGSYTITRFSPTGETHVFGAPTGSSGYNDGSATPGIVYDYLIQAAVTAPPVNGSRWPEAIGHVASGIEVPLVDDRGSVVLLVDARLATPLALELTRLKADLEGDGWLVLRRDIPASLSPLAVREMVRGLYNAEPTRVRSVFLLGNLPVPYSGEMSPDGHPDHHGSWPADVYYGEMDGTWTDSTVNTIAATHFESHNVPGDGKFDQTLLPSAVELAVGRVDLSELNAFAPLTEVQLLRRYLDRNHRWRHGEIEIPLRAFLDENILTGYLEEPFSSSSRRAAGSLFGPANVIDGRADANGSVLAENLQRSFFPETRTTPYAFARVSGSGSFESVENVATTGDFVSGGSKAFILSMFGSYFGDWDFRDCVLRAPLAATGNTLATWWDGQPAWYFHQLGMGATFGEITRFTQNGGYPEQLAPAPAMRLYERGVHLALMGDPSLRLHPVRPPSDAAATRTSGGAVELNWSASPDADRGYAIYRRQTSGERYHRLTPVPISGTRFTDNAAPATSAQYMVRAIALTSAASGTYVNASQGRAVQVSNFTPPPQQSESAEFAPLIRDRFDGATIGALVGAASYSPDGVFGEALRLGSTDSSATLVDSAATNLTGDGGDYAVAFWLRLQQGATGKWRNVLHKGDRWEERSPMLQLNPDDNRLQFRCGTSVWWNEGSDSIRNLPVGRWTHVVCVKRDRSLELYLDGSIDVVAKLEGEPAATTRTVRLGKTPWTGGGAYDLDELQIYHRALTRSEIAQLANSRAAFAANDPAASGLAAEYYEGIHFNQRRLARIDSKVDFLWGTRSPDATLTDDGFSVRWRGQMVPEFSQRHTLYARHEDGVRVRVNGQLIIDRWSVTSAVIESTAGVDLVAGEPVDLEVDYFDSGGDGAIQLDWWCPAIGTRESIPRARLLPATIDYPATLAGSTPLSDSDGDGDVDLLEHALGLSAGTGLRSPSSAFFLELSSNGTSHAAVLRRPETVSDVSYTIEGSVGLPVWQDLPITSAALSSNRDGTETVRLPQLEQLSPLSPALGFVRLRVAHLTSGAVAYSSVLGWSRTPLQQGLQTFSPGFAPVAEVNGRITAYDAASKRVSFAGGGDLRLALDPDTPCYLEFVSGALEGHRLDGVIDSLGSGSIQLAATSSCNTISLQDAAPLLSGAHAVIRPHWLLGTVFDKSQHRGSPDPSLADQVLVYGSHGFEPYFLLDAPPAFHLWTSTANALLLDSARRVMAPDDGCFVNAPAASPSGQVRVTGEVRQHAAVQNLRAGYQLLSHPYPVNFSPSSRGFTLADGFIGATDPSSADRIFLWHPDTAPTAPAGYQGMFLLDGGTATPYRYWTSLTDAALNDYSDSERLPYNRAFFLSLESPPAVYRVRPPWQ